MIYFKGCPRCTGDVVLELYSDTPTCLSCAREYPEYLEVLLFPTKLAAGPQSVASRKEAPQSTPIYETPFIGPD